jgi:hypothetical protein
MLGTSLVLRRRIAGGRIACIRVPGWAPSRPCTGSLIEPTRLRSFTDTCLSTEFRMEKTVRVLVAIRPRLIRELVLATIADQPDIEIAGEVLDDAEILAAVERTHPAFLIVAMDKPERRPSVCDALLRQYPEMKILALAPERNITVFYWASLDIHAHRVEASEEGILGALRGRSHATGGEQ